MITMGIDIGTTSICVILYNTKSGQILQKVTIDNEFPFADNLYAQDAEHIVKKVSGLVEQIWSEEICGIGISSQMHGIVYVDKEGVAVSPFYTWKEECGNEKYRDGMSYAQYVSYTTGYQVYSGYGMATHFYLQKKNQISRNAVKFVGIGDYVAMRMIGEKSPMVSNTMGASFGIYDIQRNEFDLKAMLHAGIRTEYIPRLVSDGSIAGRYKEVPMLWSLGDNQASFYGAVGNVKNSVSVNVGTGSQVSMFSKEYHECDSIEIRPFPDGGYLYVGASLNGGKVYEKFASFLQEVCMILTGTEIDAYSEMEKVLMKVEHTDLKAAPRLYGNRGEVFSVSGFFGLNDKNFHLKDMLRSYVAGMAEELKALYDMFPEDGKSEKRQIIASGNGIRKNKAMIQETEKIFEMPVIFATSEEEAASGASKWIGNVISRKQ